MSHFSVDVDKGIATVLMDRDGDDLNTLDPTLMGEFEAVLDRLESDAGIIAVVIASGKPDNFLAGANIKWLAELTNAATAEAAIGDGHAAAARLESLHNEKGKPVIAAIHGACLGGGLELALACSHRLATDSPKTQLGQPEVQLGVMPAMGGTQRLPRLIGIAAAVDLILTGRSLDAKKAARLGLVDEVVPPSMLLDLARNHATAALDASRSDQRGSWRKRLKPAAIPKLALESSRVGRRVLFRRARARLREETRGNYPAPERALEAVRIGVEEGPEAGYAAEKRFFGELVTSPESAALRSIFFATRGGPETSGARRVDKVAVVGGGLMGAGIATVSTLRAGAQVRIKEVDPDAARRALEHLAGELERRVARRRLPGFEAEKARLRVTASGDWDGIGGSDLVIEAVFEDLDLKHQMLREVEKITTADTVFASNTSSLPIARIAEASSRPETVVGMHYFSPVEKMPLLEVVVTDQSAGWAEATAVEFGKRQGKTVIVVGDGTGFYTTRILGPYSNEAFHLLVEGAAIEDIDGAMEAWGFPVGPLRLADEVGIDVGTKIGAILVEAFGPRLAGPDMLSGLAESDRRGRKNRRGFYAYDSSGRRTGTDSSVYADLGVTPASPVPRPDIQERLSLAMINEAARCLEEGILRSATDGDVGAVMGLGFPPFRGGPFFWIDRMGPERVVERLENLAVRHGRRFEPAQILVDAAGSGSTFRRA